MKYKAWIPTNNGALSQFRVAGSYSPETWQVKNNILQLVYKDTFDYSDTVVRDNEIPLSYVLDIDFNFSCWKFKLKVTVGAKTIIESNGEIERNGIIKFSFTSPLDTVPQTLFSMKWTSDKQNISLSNFEYHRRNISEPFDKIQNFPNTIFTIVKNCIHGNNHHEQKVDRFIPIQEEKFFKYSIIAKQLSNMIKGSEFEAKRILRDNIQNSRQLSIVIKLYEKAKGFKTYYDTFCHLFNKELLKENKNIGYPKNVLLSIESIKKQLEVKSSDSKFAITIFFSILAFFISSNILIKPQENVFLNDYHVILFEAIVIISISIAIFIDHRYIGIIHKAMAPIVKAKEYYQRVFLYGEAVKKYNLKIPNDKKIYYYFGYNLLRYGYIILGFIFAGLIAYGIYFTYTEQKNNQDAIDTSKLNLIHSEMNNVETVRNDKLIQYIDDINRSLFSIKTANYKKPINVRDNNNSLSQETVQNLIIEVIRFKNEYKNTNFDKYLYDINKSISSLKIGNKEQRNKQSLIKTKKTVSEKIFKTVRITDSMRKRTHNGQWKNGHIITQIDDLQNFLITIGLKISDEEKEQEYFGKTTEIAVAKFQASRKLKSDGIVGEKTKEEINSYITE